MFQEATYQQRRTKLKNDIKKGIILLLGNEESSMNYKDNLYPFRQDSSFLYFTGLNRPGLALLIDPEQGTEILFGDELTVEDIVWMGPQTPLRDEAAQAGLLTVQPSKALDAAIQKIQSGKRALHFLPPYRPETALKISAYLQLPTTAIAAQASVPLIKAIVAQRSVKSAEEVAEITKAVNTTAAMQLAAMQQVRAGITEAALAGILQGLAVSAGGNLSFPTILTVNGQYLHNHYSDSILQPGQTVLCDCGAATAMQYAGDMTRTFPVDQQFSTRQKEIYNIVLHSYQQAVAALKPGRLFKDIHLLACAALTEGLQQIGLMKGDIQESVAAGAHTLFFPCGLGHMLGLDTHDMENLGEAYVGYTDNLKQSTEFGLKSLRLGRTLEAGFVVTVEPGLYFTPQLIDAWKQEKKLASFINYNKLEAYRQAGGTRIEEDFLITPDGYQLLGDPLPITAEGIETIRQAI